MANTSVNKVVYGGNTLIDITDTTATADDVAAGKIFYLADGTRAVGTMAQDVWIRTRYPFTYSVSGSGSVNITKNQLGISVPDGYTLVGYTSISTGNANVIPRSWNAQSTPTGTSIVLRNVTSTAVSNQSFFVDVLYMKTSAEG